ncbi:hypothetical protein D3C72_1877020 [compost metagenome]
MISSASPFSKLMESDPRVCGPTMPMRPETSPRASSSVLRLGAPGLSSSCAMVESTLSRESRNGFTKSAFIFTS